MTASHALRSTSTPTTTLTVTVLDAATIYEGPETVYRYDLPGTGIVEGWALDTVLDQVEKICGADWPDVTVDIIDDPSGTEVSTEAVAILRRQLRAAGASVVEPEPPAVPAPPPPVRRSALQDSDDDEDGKDLTPGRTRPPRPRRSRRAAVPRFPLDIDPFYIAIAVMVLLVAGVSWWAVGRKDAALAASSSADGATATAVPSGSPSPRSTVEAPVTATADTQDSSEKDSGSQQLRPGQQVIEVEEMSLVLPQGFRTSVEDGLVTAAGEDPNLRILLAADPLFNVPVDVLFDEIRQQIESDPSLHDPAEESGRLSYTEDPGDGSRVTWMMWEDKGHQMSVGCHTKFEPNVVQKAACRMAAESLVKKD